MRFSEIATTKIKYRKKLDEMAQETIKNDSFAWVAFNNFKKDASLLGEQLAGTYQLFVPRSVGPVSRSERVRSLIGNEYAWNDQGDLNPNYQKWVNQGTLGEAAPILKPGKAESPPGDNKPMNAHLWTSTAKKTDNGWVSSWSAWVNNNQPKWYSNTGYLYKVKPGALILPLDNDYEIRRILNVYQDLGRAKQSDPTDSYYDYYEMRRYFPWDEISKHFDAVHHYGFHNSEFLYGWDVESTAWFDVSFLEYLLRPPCTSLAI